MLIWHSSNNQPYLDRINSFPWYRISTTWILGRSDVVALFKSKHSLASFGLEITTAVCEPILTYEACLFSFSIIYTRRLTE